MATDFHPDTEQTSAAADIDYDVAEGLVSPATAPASDGRVRQEWMMVGIALAALVAVLAIVVSVFAFASSGGSGHTTTIVRHAAAAAPAAVAAPAKAPTLADAKGVAFEKYAKVDPTLPAVPAGAVKKFTIDVFQHVTQVDANLAPTEAWSYAVNGKAYRGTAASPPIVVDQGDRVHITFVNGGSKKMAVNMAHSIDFHSAEVAPNKSYVDVAPGKKLAIDFVAKHPGVFMYHCATQPVLMHTSAGMMGMMVVKPRHLPPVDKELWLTQEEFYLGAPGKPADRPRWRLRPPTSSPSTATPTSTRPARSPCAAARGSACTSSTPARAGGAPSTSSAPCSTPRTSRASSAATPRPCRSRRARAAGSSSPSTTRATTRS
jgi:hypothetical protein